MNQDTIDDYTKAVIPRWNEVNAKLKQAAVDCERDSGTINVVGVTKRHPVEIIIAAYNAGVVKIGESFIQEAEEKRPVVDEYLKAKGVNPSSLQWHMIGKLQSNKAAKAVELFDVIESVDSVKLAKRLSRLAVEQSKTLKIFIELNISGEANKSGFEMPTMSAADILPVLAEVCELPALQVMGLMAIGPLTDDTERISKAFGAVREILAEIHESHPSLAIGNELSMGMSDDFLLAIAAGSTMVRIGTAIFGSRPAMV